MAASKSSWPKVLAAIAVAFVIVIVALFQFTSLQVPDTFFSKSKPLEVGGGLKNVTGGTVTRNNLDEVNDILQGKKAISDTADVPTSGDQ